MGRRVIGAGLAALALGVDARAALGDWDTPLPYVPCLGGVVAAPVGTGLLVLVSPTGKTRTLYKVPAGGTYSLFSPEGAFCNEDGGELGVVARSGMAGASVAIVSTGRKPEVHGVASEPDAVLWLDAQYVVASTVGPGGVVGLALVDRRTRETRELAFWREATHKPYVAARDAIRVRWLRMLSGGETLLEEAPILGGPGRVVRRFAPGNAVTLSRDGATVAWHLRAEEDRLHLWAVDGPREPEALGAPARYHFARFSGTESKRFLSVFAMTYSDAPSATLITYALDGTSLPAAVRLEVAWSDPLVIDAGLDRVAHGVAGGEVHASRPSDPTRVKVLAADPGARRDSFGLTRDGRMLLWVRTVFTDYRKGRDPATDEYDTVRELWGAPDVWAGPSSAGAPRKLLRLFAGVVRKTKGP